jgi:transposase
MPVGRHPHSNHNKEKKMNIFKRVEVAHKIVALHNEGKPRAEIKQALGVSDNQIVYVLKHAREAGIHVERRSSGRPSDPKIVARREEVARRYKAGESGPSIARGMGIQVETVYASLRALGIERRKPVTDLRNETIVLRYTVGESGVTIAKQLGVTPKVVYDTLHRAGITVRPRGARRKSGK